MDHKLSLIILLFLSSSLLVDVVNGNLGFPVHYKFKGQKRSLSALKAHDLRRHSRFPFDVDLELGGNANPFKDGLYFAKIGIGSPSKDYYVQVDTGSHNLWVNCINCKNCPKTSDLLKKLTLYDQTKSSTSTSVACDQPFCTSIYDGPLPGCRNKYLVCPYYFPYGDGSSTIGYYVKDTVQLDRVTENLQTTPVNGSIIFGCAVLSAFNSSSGAVDGLLGFGQANESMISQLASAGKVKKMFAHCLDNINGGGIFAIGEVVQPKVKTVPLVPHRTLYNIVMKYIEVGQHVLQLPTIFESGIPNRTIIDSGTTLVGLPDIVYNTLMTKILDHQPGLQLQTEEGLECFQYNGSVDGGFPTVKFHFVGSLSFTVYPHEYLFYYLKTRDNLWCLGWQNMGDSWKSILLGDMVLSNKLVFYDLENQAIGWTEYNCSTSIKVKDKSGVLYSVGAHHLV